MSGTLTGPALAVQQGVNALDYLRSRGFIYDVTDEEGLHNAFAAGPVTIYQGFDPTATSMHIGNLVGIMLLANLQRLGHRPIALGGGGTVMLGDPTGRTEMRQIMTVETIQSNLNSILPQFGRYIDFDGGRFGDNLPALLLNNADWLLDLQLIPFLRDIGKHFPISEMLAAETYKTRLESTGLTLLEFNYRVLQAYDFLHMYRTINCIGQAGGSDQWGNITAGTDLIRREGGKAYGLVTPLVTTSDGRKMGKSAEGAVWLDAERTSPYDFYQWWVNTTDDDIAFFLRIYTFLQEDEISDLTSVTGVALNTAKQRLAHEVTAMTHGVAAADEAAAFSSQLFPRRYVESVGQRIRVSAGVADQHFYATIHISPESPVAIGEMFVRSGLVSSRNEARRLALQGGMHVDEQRVTDADVAYTGNDGAVLLQVGKKRKRMVKVVFERANPIDEGSEH